MPNNIYRAVIYIRLSEADEGKSYESESESITNQRNLLMNFVKEKGFIFVGEYVDDGYSGTNFERPGFTKMIEDIKNKMVNLSTILYLILVKLKVLCKYRTLHHIFLAKK